MASAAARGTPQTRMQARPPQERGGGRYFLNIDTRYMIRARMMQMRTTSRQKFLVERICAPGARQAVQAETPGRAGRPERMSGTFVTRPFSFILFVFSCSVTSSICAGTARHASSAAAERRLGSERPGAPSRVSRRGRRPAAPESRPSPRQCRAGWSDPCRWRRGTCPGAPWRPQSPAARAPLELRHRPAWTERLGAARGERAGCSARPPSGTGWWQRCAGSTRHCYPCGGRASPHPVPRLAPCPCQAVMAALRAGAGAAPAWSAERTRSATHMHFPCPGPLCRCGPCSACAGCARRPGSPRRPAALHAPAAARAGLYSLVICG